MKFLNCEINLRHRHLTQRLLPPLLFHPGLGMRCPIVSHLDASRKSNAQLIALDPVKKRVSRRKLHPEMNQSALAGSRILRPNTKPSLKALQLSEGSAFSRIRQWRTVDMAKELDIEALIAISVGFPVDGC